MADREMYDEIVEAVGPERAEQLIVQDMGSIKAVYEYLQDEGMVGG
jgi:hypothetical protein